MTKSYSLFSIISLTFLTGCASYQISSSSLSDQLTSNIVSKGYLFATDAVKGNDLKTIKCLDKNGKEKEIIITNRTGVRITKVDNTRKTFYFNTLLIKDSSIVGSKTHFFNDQIRPIKFSDIIKIEVIE